MITTNDKYRCDLCSKFMSEPYDSRTIFGCADPSAPEPYDPDEFCKKCSEARYKKLLAWYSCCGRDGDYIKSNAEIRAAKDAGLVWVGNSNTLVEKHTGRSIMNRYIRGGTEWMYVPYLEYQAKRREEKRCKCWRKKDENGNCPTCGRQEVYCLCIYSGYEGRF